MGEHLINSLLTVATAIVGVAIIAVLVSNKAQTGQVITSAGSALANDLLAATAPVTGNSGTINTGGGFTMGLSELSH